MIKLQTSGSLTFFMIRKAKEQTHRSILNFEKWKLLLISIDRMTLFVRVAVRQIVSIYENDDEDDVSDLI
jgi:hypothetical protein